MTDEAPTLAERYACATNAKSLKVSPNSSAAPPDVLMAVALSGDSLGATLMRLRAEFDVVAAEVKDTGNNGLTDRLLALMQLKTLEPAKDQIASLARKMAAANAFEASELDLMRLAGRVLDVFLSPNCWHCDGRGFTGGGRHEQTTAMVLCRPCGGTGRRRHDIGRNAAERAFAAQLLATLERSADRAASGAMKKVRTAARRLENRA